MLQNILELEIQPTLKMRLWLGNHNTPGVGIWGVVEEICTVPTNRWLMHPETHTVLRVSLIRDEDHSVLETRPGWTHEDWEKREKAAEEAPNSEEKGVTLLGSF